MIDFIPVQTFIMLYYWGMTTVCGITGVYFLGQPGCKKLLVQNSGLFPFLFAVFITIYLGWRPLSIVYFGDMGMYTRGYWLKSSEFTMSFFDLREEWFFEWVMKTCMQLKVDVFNWFLLVEVFYIGTQTWACKKLLRENLWLPLLFIFFAYQFFSFGTNGIRNGMACGLMTLSIAFCCDRNFKGYFWGIFLALLAMGCHRSIIIPIMALYLSLFYVKKIKTSVIIWVFAIFLSLVAGGFFQSLIMGLGFDDRMDSYSASRATHFSHMGFRWDFLLYSSVPVLFAAYVEHKRKADWLFSILANTYILSNSVWVLVCRMAYSNRVAYLSWFMYALVLAYGVVRLPLSKDQDRVAGWVLLGHTAFTISMYLLGK